MREERLSKLQKWILKTCYDRSLQNYMTSRQELLFGYFSNKNQSSEASLSRSLWLLLDRGYITELSAMKVEIMAIIYGMRGKNSEDFKKDYEGVKLNEKVAVPSMRKFNKIKIITITNKGKEKAKELLKVK